MSPLLPLRPVQNYSFKNQDLAREDFSYCDLRGCDFSEAILAEASFQGVFTGQSRSQVLVRRAIVATSTVIVPFAVVGALSYTSAFAYGILITFVILLALPVAFIYVNEPFFKTKALFVVSVSVAFAAISGLDIAFFAKSISAFKEVDFLSVNFPRQARFMEGMGYAVFSLIILGSEIYTFLEMIRMFREAPGTSFKYADLSGANFSSSVLQNADFSNSKLDYVNWTQAQLHRCKFPPNFADTEVRDLCIYRNGQNHDFRHADLRRLYLSSVKLADANLAKANLNESDLSHANLENVDLSNAQALGTIFTGATLTGACIHNWGINSTTVFTDVKCDYIYLETGQKERRPVSGIFEPGDFEKLVYHCGGTLDFLLRNGVDPQAFYSALRSLLTEYKDADLSICSVIEIGDGDKLIQLNANPQADKETIDKKFQNLQKSFLEVADRNRALEKDLAHTEGKIAVYKELQIGFGQTTISIQNSQVRDVMIEKGNKVQIGNVTGDISGISGGDISGVAGKDISGTAGTNISGTLSISMEKLEKTQDPEAIKLAELLKQLKDAVEKADSGLSEDDRKKVLKHLDAIAQLGTNHKNLNLLEKTGDALDALPTIIKRGEGLKEFAEKCLPSFTAGIRTILSVWGIHL